MRLSVVTSDSVPAVGGIADYLHGLMAASVGAIDWHLWSLAPAGPGYDASLPYAVTRFDLEPRSLGDRSGDRLPPIRRMNTLLWRRRRASQCRAVLSQAVAEDHPDLVVIGRWCEEAHAWCHACRNLGVPYILMTYGLELAEPVSHRMASARHRDLASAALVCGCSSHTIRLVRDVLGIAPQPNRGQDPGGCSEGPPRSLVLFPGIDPERLQPLPETECLGVLREMGLGERPFVLAMGRLVHRKGFDLAVRAFARLAGKASDVDLVVAGDGEARDEVTVAIVNSGCASRIHCVGQVTDLQKRALLQGCEFYMMPNRPVPGDMEGFGIVFLEANLFGKAVIGGNNGGVPDAVVHEETGLLVDSTDLDCLVRAMDRLLSDHVFRDRCGARGRERALASFQWSALAEGFVSAVRALAPSEPRVCASPPFS